MTASWNLADTDSLLSDSYLELGLDVLTGRALRGAGGGILAGTSSEK